MQRNEDNQMVDTAPAIQAMLSVTGAASTTTVFSDASQSISTTTWQPTNISVETTDTMLPTLPTLAAARPSNSTTSSTLMPQSATTHKRRTQRVGRSVSSDVWRYFDRELDEQGKFLAARCRRCQRQIRGATATLRGHLKSRLCLEHEAASHASRAPESSSSTWTEQLPEQLPLTSLMGHTSLATTTSQPLDTMRTKRRARERSQDQATNTSVASARRRRNVTQQTVAPVESDTGISHTSGQMTAASQANHAVAMPIAPAPALTPVTNETVTSATPVQSTDAATSTLETTDTMASDNATPTISDAERRLIRWILGDQVSYSTVDNSEFRSFCRALNPNFHLPTAQELRDKILSMI
jgi:hypothetical protein